jgi:hypothetical protein
MRSLLVPVLAWMVACASVALSQEKQVNPLVSKEGKLTQELEVHELESGGLAAKSRRWTIKPDGAWVLAVRDVGVLETKGKLSKEKLKALADDLAKYGLSTLPNKILKNVPPGAKSYEVRYGNRQTTTTCVLPKPDPKTLDGRYAGVINALERHLKETDKNSSENGKN